MIRVCAACSIISVLTQWGATLVIKIRERENAVLVTHDMPRSRLQLYRPHAYDGSMSGSTRLRTILIGESAHVRAPFTPDTGYDTTHWVESDDSEYLAFGRNLYGSPL
jgi:hypothetical protein